MWSLLPDFGVFHLYKLLSVYYDLYFPGAVLRGAFDYGKGESSAQDWELCSLFSFGGGHGGGVTDSFRLCHSADGLRQRGFSEEGGILFFRAGYAGQTLRLCLHGAGAGPLAKHLLWQRGADADSHVFDE